MESDAFERLKYGNEQQISTLYRVYMSAFVRYIGKAFHCPSDKAKEIYPEAFSILYFNIKHEKLTAPLKSTLQTYLNSTGWNLYHRRYLDKYARDKVDAEIPDNIPEARQLVDTALIQQERATHLRTMLESLGEPCKSLLYQVYYDEKSYGELSVSMALPESTLRKRKFDCLGKLRKLFDEHQLDL